MEHRVKLEVDNDAVIIELPDGKEVVVWLNDMECDAFPQLHIELPEPLCANCWMPGVIPSEPLDEQSKNVLKTTEIHIPIENACFGAKHEANLEDMLNYVD